MSVATAPRPAPVRAYAALYPPRFPGNRVGKPTRPTGLDGVGVSPEQWARVLAAAVLDAVEGRRDIRTLARWMTRDLFVNLQKVCQERPPGPKNPKPAKAHSVRVWSPQPECAEVAVTLWDRDRLRAVAMRLQLRRGRWVVNALEFG